jgi:hypothetical protein
MTAQEQALSDLCRALEDSGVPYMLVGGQANAVWGEPRATLDIDVTVWAEGRTDVASFLASRFRALVDDAEGFVRQTRVLPLESAAGVRLDVIFGMLPFSGCCPSRKRPSGARDRFASEDTTCACALRRISS